MPSYIFQKNNNLSQLHDELLAALPALRPVVNAQGDALAVMQVEGRSSDGFIRLTVPSRVSREEIQAVVDAHVADSTYGSTPQPSESDVLSMNDRDFRQWVFRLLGPTQLQD